MPRHALIAAALALSCAAAHAQPLACKNLGGRVYKEQSWIRPVQGMVVSAPQRLHFHSAPDAACVSQVYVVHGDALTAYNEWQGWFSVQYTHPKSGKISSGWVKGDGLRATGALGLDTRPSPAGQPPKLPQDAAKVVERLANCTHFAGEFNGDQSEHDRQVNKTMMELGCNRIDTDVAAMRGKYAGNAAVLQALDQAEEP